MHDSGKLPQPPPWIFAITNLPFGVAGTYAAVAMPFFLKKAGVDLGTIAAMSALALLPASYQLFWAPILDLGIRRRAWLVLMSVLGSLCLGFSLMLQLPQHLVAFEVCMVLGQALVGLVGSCNGALVSLTLPTEQKGRAAGYINAANLGASALGGGVVLTLANKVSIEAAALALVLMIMLPAFAAFAIPEPPPDRGPLLDHLRLMAKDVWAAVRSRRGWTGLLFCISPVGTVALGNLFSGMGDDFHVPSGWIEGINGYAGGFVTAAGALAAGYLLDRVDRRKAYLWSGVLTAVVAAAMAMGPLNATTYVVGALFYLLVTGLAYAAFSAVVYEIVGTAGKTASTLYSVFPAAGNMAIAYTMLADGKAHDVWGTRGTLWADAALNIVGVFALILLLQVVFKDRKAAAPAGIPFHPALELLST